MAVPPLARSIGAAERSMRALLDQELSTMSPHSPGGLRSSSPLGMAFPGILLHSGSLLAASSQPKPKQARQLERQPDKDTPSADHAAFGAPCVAGSTRYCDELQLLAVSAHGRNLDLLRTWLGPYPGPSGEH